MKATKNFETGEQFGKQTAQLYIKKKNYMMIKIKLLHENLMKMLLLVNKMN